MTDKQQREELSRAYLAAVAGACGFKTTLNWSQDDGCLDATVASGKFEGVRNVKIDFQLKCTNKHDRVTEDQIKFQLERDHYDALRDEDRASTHLLVVVLLARKEEDWLRVSRDELMMREAAYYVDLVGSGEITTGKDSTTVVLPRKNLLTPQALMNLMKAEAEDIKAAKAARRALREARA